MSADGELGIEHNATDPVIPFRIVTDEAFPGGVMCPVCERKIAAGRPFKADLYAVNEGGDTFSMIDHDDVQRIGFVRNGEAK